MSSDKQNEITTSLSNELPLFRNLRLIPHKEIRLCLFCLIIGARNAFD